MANKEFINTVEAAERLGVTAEYVRELLNRAKYDKTIKLKGSKVGKEWRIDPKSINVVLGINVDEKDFKKDLYIKELEGQIKVYKTRILAFETLADTFQRLIGS